VEIFSRFFLWPFDFTRVEKTLSSRELVNAARVVQKGQLLGQLLVIGCWQKPKTPKKQKRKSGVTGVLARKRQWNA
jgi:hypothetical protein